MTTYHSTPFDICVTPIFVKDGIEYPFEGLTAGQLGGENMEFRFILNTLRWYFGDDLDIEGNGTHQIRILLHSKEQMRVLGIINEDTCEFPVKYGRAHLKFEFHSFNYDKPLCDGTLSCKCKMCECD